MKKQLRFVMHPLDEEEIVNEILKEQSVHFINGPRWKTSVPASTRSIVSFGYYCIIWSKEDRDTLTSKYIPTCDDWYCDSENSTIQFLRSRVSESVLIEGRFAVNTNELTEIESNSISQRFNRLSRFVKRNYKNKLVFWLNPNLPMQPASTDRSSNPSKPDAQLWVGPHALEWLSDSSARCVKQDERFIVEGRLIENLPNKSRHS